MRAICDRKVVDRQTTEKQINMLGLKETVNGLATANGVGWYENVLRRNDDNVSRVVIDLEASGKKKSEDEQRRPGRSK